MLNEFVVFALKALWFILPAYVANPAPVVFGGGVPIDFGKKLSDGKPILGKGKTWRGAFAGIALGTIAAYFQGIVCETYALETLGFVKMNVVLGLLLSSGAIFGDIVESFAKRRMNIERGAPLPVFDQIDFVVGALVFAALYVRIDILMAVFLLIITPIVHRAANIIAYKLKLKKVPW